MLRYVWKGKPENNRHPPSQETLGCRILESKVPIAAEKIKNSVQCLYSCGIIKLGGNSPEGVLITCVV